MNKRSFIILGGAGLPWVYPLAVELGRSSPTVAINLTTAIPFGGNTSRWSYDDPEGLTQRETWSYIPGFSSKFKFIFRLLIRNRLNMLIKDLYRRSGEHPYVIVMFPWDYPYVSDVVSDHLIYLNYDDYLLNEKNSLEKKLIGHAGVILCSSSFQAERFKKSFPERELNVFHFPHGVHDTFINARSEQSFDPKSVCIVGRLSARYDWKLIYEVVTQLFDVTFSFVGDFDAGAQVDDRSDWKKTQDAVLSLPNVKHIQGLKHCQTPTYYWETAVNWIPYMVSLSFIRACCPLKLPDGLASGHQVISADVPECRLYPEWVKIYKCVDEAVDLISAALRNADIPEGRKRQLAQIEFARKNNWAERAKRLTTILARDSTNA